MKKNIKKIQKNVKNIKGAFKSKNVEKTSFLTLLFLTITFVFTILYFYILKNYNNPIKYFEQYIYCNNAFFDSRINFNNTILQYNFKLLLLQLTLLFLTYYFLYLILKIEENKKSFFDRKTILYTILILILTPTYFNIIQNYYITITNTIILFLLIILLKIKEYYNKKEEKKYLYLFIIFTIISTILLYYYSKIIALYYIILLLPLTYKNFIKEKNKKYKHVFFSTIILVLITIYLIKKLFYFQTSIMFEDYTFFFNSFIYEYSNTIGLPLIIYFLSFLALLYSFEKIEEKTYSFIQTIIFFTILLFIKEYNLFLIIPLTITLFNSTQYIFYNKWNYKFTKNILLTIIFLTLIVSSYNNFNTNNNYVKVLEEKSLKENIMLYSTTYSYFNCKYNTIPKNYSYNESKKIIKILTSNNIIKTQKYVQKNNISTIIIDKDLLLEKTDKENSGFFSTKKFLNMTKTYDLFYYNRILEVYTKN